MINSRRLIRLTTSPKVMNVHFFHLLDICHLNAFIMYQQCYVQWNSGLVEEDATPMMDPFAEITPPGNRGAALHCLPLHFFVPQAMNQST